jgi:hypothetical protein
MSSESEDLLLPLP